MRNIFFSLLLTVLLAGCCSDRHAMQDAISRQMAQFPQSTLQDIYKSFYQAHFGAEHMIGDTAAVRAYLLYELAAAAQDTTGSSPYVEPVGANGACVRVYLRCVTEEKITAEQLLDAFIRSAKPTEQAKRSWADEWTEIERMATEYNVPCPEEDRQLLRQAAQNNQAVHHSAAYRDAYHPHYRIVRRDIVENEFNLE